MPKDPTKNIDRYKIRGGTLNEYEFAENQEAYAEQKSDDTANLIPGTPPEQREAPRPAVTKGAAENRATKATTKGTKARATKAARATQSTTSSKATKGTKKQSVVTRGATAKKLAARKAAKKAGTKKAAANTTKKTAKKK